MPWQYIMGIILFSGDLFGKLDFDRRILDYFCDVICHVTKSPLLRAFSFILKMRLIDIKWKNIV